MILSRIFEWQYIGDIQQRHWKASVLRSCKAAWALEDATSLFNETVNW